MARNVKTAGAALATTRSPLSVSDGLENVVAGLGTSRDKASFSQYVASRPMSNYELENMYRGSWLAKRIVNAVADDMTREGREIQFDGSNDLQFAVEKEERRLAVPKKINEALRWARLFGGAAIIVGIRGQKLNEPLVKESIGKGSLQWLQVVDRWRLSASGQRTTDLESPNFGLPNSYVLAESSVEVHHTRVLRYNGQLLPYFSFQANGMWHDSELHHVYDSIMSCDTASRAIATMLFEANVDVVQSEDLTQTLSMKNGEALLLKRFQTAATLKSFNRMLLLDGKEKYEKKSNSFANLDKIWMQFMIDVCGAADIPMTRLFGQTASGLGNTGDNDIRNYYDKCSANQESEMRAQQEALDEILVRSAVGHMPDDFRFDYKPLWQISGKERSEIETAAANRDKIYIEAGVLTEGVVARQLKETGTYATLTDEDIEAVEDLDRTPEPEGKEDDIVVDPPKEIPKSELLSS